MTKKAARPVVAVVIHDLGQAVAALEAAAALRRPVEIWSAVDAAIYAGPGWFAAVERQARAAAAGAKATFILDCADRSDLAQAAFTEGIGQICFTGSTAAALRLSDIATKWRAKLRRRRPRALDLLDEDDPVAACRRHLGGN